MYLLAKNDVIEQYPYTVAQLKRDNPQTSFPAELNDVVLSSFGVYPVKQTSIPTFDAATHKAVEDTPTKVDDVWQQNWIVVVLTDEEKKAAAQALQDSIVQQTQDRLDNFARERGYDDIKSASDYAGCSVPKFNAEGTYCRDARAETWDKLYDILGEVQAGTRPMPTSFADIEPELPPLVWP